MSRGSLIRLLWGENRGLNILLLVLLAANLCAYLVQAQVLDKKMTGVRTEVRERQQSLRKLHQQKEAGSMPVSELARVETELEKFENQIPEEDKLSDLIGEVYGYAAKSKLGIKQIAYSPEWDEDLALLRYSLKFTVSGQYSQLKRFIHLLERAERLLIVSDIKLRSAGATADAEVSLDIELETFFRDMDR